MQYSHVVQGVLFKGGQAKHLPKYTGYISVTTAHVIINLLCYWPVLGWRCSHLQLFFSAKLPISQSQSLCHCRSFFLSRSRTWHLFLLNIIRLLSASYSSLATCPWGYQLVSLTWCHLQIFQDWTPLSSSLLCYICWISKGLVQILAALKFLFIFR